MTGGDTPERCAVCAAIGRIEHHHIALREHLPTATVPVCPDCHRRLTAGQWRSGVLPAGGRQDLAVLAWAATDGIAALIAASARSVRAPREASQSYAGMQRAIGRLLTLLAVNDDSGLGPDPIANDRRRARHRDRRASTAPTPADTGPAMAAFARAVLPALADACAELLADTRHRDYIEVVRRLAAGAPALVATLATLDRDGEPRLAELAGVLARDRQVVLDALEALAAAERDDESPADALRTLCAVEGAWIYFALALSGCPDGRAAAALIDRFVAERRGPA